MSWEYWVNRVLHLVGVIIVLFWAIFAIYGITRIENIERSCVQNCEEL